MNCLKAQHKYELMGLYFGEIFVFTSDVTGGGGGTPFPVVRGRKNLFSIITLPLLLLQIT